MLLRLISASCLLVCGVCLAEEKPAEKLPEKPFGLTKRIPLTTSKVIGYPEPPLPYRSAPVFTKIKFNHPLYIIALPGTERLLVIEQGGKIISFPDDPQTDKTEVFLELKDRDFYGMTFHPKFAENRYALVFSNGPNSAKSKLNRISRFTVSKETNKCLPETEFIIIEWVSNGHNGGDMAFAADGTLFATSGDGTSDSDTNLTGQDISDLNSGMLHLDIEHPDPGKGYSVPKDNPFLNIPKARPELWAYGFRNPWRLHIDPQGNLWCGDIGQDQWEMIEVVKKGDNYGWSNFEGGHPFYLERTPGPTPITKPLIVHPHSEARSITGGVTYLGSKFPELKGAYVYGDYGTGKIWMVRYDGQKVTEHREIADTPFALLGFGLDRQGELYVADYNGGIHTFERIPAGTPQPEFPRKLSQTGLFESVAGHKPQPGLIPYDVNSPLWSDGAFKERFIALPEETNIAFSAKDAWKFPERSVLVKTFSLDREAGNPASRQRIETRLMVYQQNEWVGYTYLWNNEQTEAELVEPKGADRDFVIKDVAAPGGQRTQTWHYPSRAECMVCHSRAAVYALGLTTLQMNRDHDYHGVVDNQLRALAHIGVLRDALTQPTDKEPPKPSTIDLAKLERVPDPMDKSAPLEARVKSYLHANCAQCHVDAGGGNSAIVLSYATALKDMKLVDVNPLHDKFGVPDARLVAPASPERSMLRQRLSHRSRGQMPPLGTSLVDDAAVKLVDEWIRSLEPAKK